MNERRPTIALLTDFGSQDSYAAEMKGVILSINSNVNIIDINHNIEPQNILQASLMLKRSYGFFPSGTIFICVVDPDVGSKRKILLIESEDYRFIAPDNGLLWLTANELSINKIISLENYDYFLNPTPSTFEGRDKMAPAGAYLSLGIEPGQIGPIQSGIEKLEIPKTRTEKNLLIGEIIYFDRFGNAITNISMDDLVENEPKNLPVVIFGPDEIGHIVSTFSDAGNGSAVAYFGSSGYLEMAIFNGNFRLKFSARPGDRVVVDYAK
jgi:S-adenosylmethionine hydrolase